MEIDNMSIIKAHTRRAVLESPDMPDIRLMIGYTEDLQSIALQIPQTKIPKTVAKSVKHISESMDNDSLMEAIANGEISINDVSTNIGMLNEKLKLTGGGV